MLRAAMKCKPYSEITVESGTQLKIVHICSAVIRLCALLKLSLKNTIDKIPKLCISEIEIFSVPQIDQLRTVNSDFWNSSKIKQLTFQYVILVIICSWTFFYGGRSEGDLLTLQKVEILNKIIAHCKFFPHKKCLCRKTYPVKCM